MDFIINSLKHQNFKAILEHYEQNHSHELLSQHYEQATLKGLPLPNSLKVLFETHLIKTRLFEKDEKHQHDSSKGRIDFLMFLIDELNKHKESSDGVFVFISRCIASSIHILKNQLKHTYDEIPWEEMEFCLVIFIASKMGRDLTIISHLLLDRKVILCYLNDFCAALSNHNAKSNKPKTKPINRVAIKSSVLSIHPHFNKLYEDYETLRDIYSLRRIQSYMNVALTSEESQMQPHALERTLQVTGENLKNTRDSPNISLEAKERVLHPAPKYLKENLTSLRDVLSHLNFMKPPAAVTFEPLLYQPLKQILNSLQNIFFKEGSDEKGIINDLKKVCVEVSTVLYEKFIKVCTEKNIITSAMNEDIHLLFTRECKKFEEIVKECKLMCPTFYVPIYNEFYEFNHEQIELMDLKHKTIWKYGDSQSVFYNNFSTWIFETCAAFQNFDNNLVEEQINIDCVYSFPVKEIKSMADCKKVSNTDNDKKKEEESVKQKIDEICLMIENCLEGAKEKKQLYKRLEALKALHSAKAKILKGNMFPKDKYQKTIQEFPRKIAEKLGNLCPDNDLEAIKYTVNRVYDAYGLLAKTVASKDVIYVKNYKSLLSKFCKTLNLKDHSRIVNHLVKNFKKDIETYFENTLSKIMSINKIDDTNLQMVSMEMLLLDLLEILMSTYNFTDNTSYLDRPAPLLVGKNLRNYLAHGNPLIDTFPFDPRNSIQIHCTLFKDNSLNFDKDVNYNQTTNFTLESAKEFYGKRLALIENQTAMFEAASQGNMRKVAECVRNGADPSACDVNGETGLKCAAKANNVEVLMYFLERNVEESVESLLESAAENGCESIVEYLLENNQEAKECIRGNNKLLHLAALNDKRRMVRLLLNSGCKVNAVVYQRTPLHLAALKGFNVIADILINHDASITLKDNLGEQPLHSAARSGSWECAEMFLDIGADVKAKNHEGYTALQLAAMFGRAEFIDKLLQTCYNVKNALRHRALFVAAACGHEETVKVLLKHIPQPRIKTKRLQTPLHAAAYFGYKNIVELLLEHGASILDKDLNLNTPLHFAAFKGWTDLIEILFSSGLLTSRLETAFHLAAYCGNKKTIEAILDCESKKINSVDVLGRTALHVAAFRGNTDTLKVLIKAGAITNVLDEKRNTAFLVAIVAGHVEVVSHFLQLSKISQYELNCGLYSAIAYKHDEDLVEVLLKAGADPNFEAQIKCPDLDEFVLKFGYPLPNFEQQCSQGPLSADAQFGPADGLSDPLPDFKQEATVVSISCLVAAIQAGNVNTVKLLLENGADISVVLTQQCLKLRGRKKVPCTFQNFVDVRKLKSKVIVSQCTFHCLHIASLYGHTEILEILLKQQSIDKNVKDSNGYTPLCHAASYGQKNAVQVLLRAGADPNVTDSNNETPLHKTVRNGFLRATQLLLYHDTINIHIKCNSGYTILDMAVLSSEAALLKMLLNYEFTSNEGYSALRTAVQYERVEAVEVLLNSARDFNVYIKLNTLLHLAVLNNRKVDVIKMLLNKHHADVNVVITAHGETLLNIAIKYNKMDIVRLLLKYGADATKAASTDDDRTNVTPLHYAAISSDCSTILTLLLESIRKKYADVLPYVNAKDSNGDTPLLWAIKNTRSTIRELYATAALCISAGADVNLQNNEGMSALHYAMRNGDTELAQLLIENGADLNLQNKEGMSALHYAMRNGDTELAQLLIENGADETLKNKNGQTAAKKPLRRCVVF